MKTSRGNPYLGVTLLCVALAFSVACAPPRKVAVEERKTITALEESERLGGSHIRIVQPGDTLYGIAFANGLDAKKLAAWNQIADTNRLQVGKRLRLTQPPGFVAASKSPKKSRKTNQRSPALSSRESTRSSDSAGSKDPVKAVRPSDVVGWRWPTVGKVSEVFKPSQGKQGIDISGQRGQAVVAVRPGEVVYVGNGLKGYGNLVIIKHSEDFLSAYAHNLETFVREGQLLKAGERLATMGVIRGKPALHFQIRKEGEPVNPLRFLPKPS